MERELCNICLEEIHFFNSYTTPCRHSFHHECIYNWFVHNVRNHSNKTCPVCRTNLITQFNPVFTYIYSSKFYSFFDNTFIYHTMTQEDFFKYVNDSYLDVTSIELGDDFIEAAKCHEIIMNGSISKSLANYYETDKLKLHPFTLNRVEAGISVSAKSYIEAIEKAKKMKQALSEIFEKFDAIITPAAPGQAPRDLMNTGNAIFNGYWTMLGVPAISLPLLKGKDDLPIGVQIITSWNKEAELLDISNIILSQT